MIIVTIVTALLLIAAVIRVINLTSSRAGALASAQGAEAEIRRLTDELRESRSRIQAGEEALAASTEAKAELLARISAMETEASHLRAETERLRADDERFRTIAAQVLNQSRAEMRTETTGQVQTLLEPLRRELDSFSKTVSEKYSREASERHALREKIDELRLLNNAIGTEARRLSDALRGNNKMQGQWGELVLQTLLENAGLTEGREFMTQQTVDGGKRPDVVVNFPGSGCVVIDSKASMTGYMNFVDAETDDQRRAAATAHVASVRRHIDELARKNYQDFVGKERKLEFVMMFMPNEGAYLAAMQMEPNLWQEAYNKRVIIISPTHLLSILRLVEQMWRHDAQNRNALVIAEEAGKMYDKFVGFVNDLQNVETAINKASATITEAKKKLSTGPGNLTRRADNLRTLGAKTTKQLNLPAETDD